MCLYFFPLYTLTPAESYNEHNLTGLGIVCPGPSGHGSHAQHAVYGS